MNESIDSAFDRWAAERGMTPRGVYWKIALEAWQASQKQAAARAMEILISHENCGEMEHGGRYECITAASGEFAKEFGS